jgi:hypothetical protein
MVGRKARFVSTDSSGYPCVIVLSAKGIFVGRFPVTIFTSLENVAPQVGLIVLGLRKDDVYLGELPRVYGLSGRRIPSF